MSHPVNNQDTYVLVLRIYDKGEEHEENIRALLSFLSQLSFDNELYFVVYETALGMTLKVGLKCLIKDQEILRDLGYAVSWFINKKEDLIKMGYSHYSKKNESRKVL